MYKAAFQLNKVRRLIKTQGKKVQFTTPGKNEFNEPNGETVSHSIKGVFHETHPAFSHVSIETSDGTSIRQRSHPLIMALWEDVDGVITRKDIVRFNNTPYRVNDITNLLEANLVADISLEEVQT